MYFDKIFYQLLIIETLYRCGLGQFTEIAPISEIIVLNDANKIYKNARLDQYANEDNFRISHPQNLSLYLTYFMDDFSSISIEFNRLYDNEIEFVHRRADDLILLFKCVFSEKQFTQAFFRKIYSYQEKGDGVMIHRIAEYYEASQRILPYVKHADLYSKDINIFSKGYVERTYFITHFNDIDSTLEMEVDLIFSAKKFAVSEIYDNNKIALCINGISYVRILISFSNPKAGRRFLTTYMPKTMQRDDLPCEFPNNLTKEEIYDDLVQP